MMETERSHRARRPPRRDRQAPVSRTDTKRYKKFILPTAYPHKGSFTRSAFSYFIFNNGLDVRFAESQAEFIFDEEGKPMVDFVGRTESLWRDFKSLCDQLNVPHPKEFVHINKALDGKKRRRLYGTEKKPYWEYYTDETREFVGNKYQADVDHFGYKFNSSL